MTDDKSPPESAPTIDHDPKSRLTVGANDEMVRGTEHPGERIGPYVLLEVLGQGGMGAVWLAEQYEPVRRQVALKVIKSGMDSESVVARFEAERQALALMDHPNIAKVFDGGTTATGRPYFVMEVVQGIPITRYCDQEKLTVRQRFELMIPVCQAVQHAHQKGIIHRDLKPSNILVGLYDGRPVPKVIDFGVAKATGSLLAEQTMHTMEGSIVGTLEYMAPEQAEVTNLDIDTRVDIYSLGVVLYELVTGSPPFSRQKLQSAALEQMLRMIREVEPSKPSTKLSTADALPSLAAIRGMEPRRLTNFIRGDLDWIVMKCLEKERSRRYETANGLASDIQHYLAHEPVLAGPPSATYRFKKFVRRNRGIVAAGAAVAASLLIGVVAFAWQAKVARDQRDRAVYAESEANKRANELKQVADYQEKMLQQIDATDAGVQLMTDLRARHGASLEKSKTPEAERLARAAAFQNELVAVNATDTAVALLDRNVLAPAVRTITTQFADQPLVDATLRTTLGNIYYGLGRQKEALELYQRAYELRAKSLGEEHRDTLLARGGVGKVQGDLQQLADAESTIRATLTALQRSLGDDAKETLDAKALLATQMYYQGKYDECETITRDVLERRQRVLGADHADTLMSMNSLGRYLMLRGKYADAVKVLREVVATQRRAADSSVGGTLTNLGVALNRQKDYAAAEPILREALELNRRTKGEDHPSTVGSINNLASMLMEMNKLAEAEPLARESLEKCRRIYGSEYAETLKAMNVMGQVLFRQNKFNETEPYYREALTTGRRVLGEEHPDTIIWIANMGFLLDRLGRSDEAEPYHREALDKNRRQLGETHPYTITMTKRLVDMLRQRNKPADAEVIVRAALKNVRRIEGEDHAETLGLIGLLGSVLREQGKLTEAETYFQQSIEKNRRAHGDDHADTLTAIMRMASLRVAQGKNAEAIALLTPIEEKVPKAFTGMTGTLRFASLRGLLGKVRAGLAKQPAEFAEAEANLIEAQTTFAKTRGDKDKETREWTQALVDLYAAWDKAEPGKGYDAKSAEWKKNLDAVKPAATQAKLGDKK
jgi:eukaryotic-like serine/threonine-protein kinase